MKSVALSCVYRRTSQGCLSLKFAADLLTRLKVQALGIYVPSDAHTASLLTGDTATLMQAQGDSIRRDVASITGLALEQLRIVNKLESGIIVDGDIGFDCQDVVDLLFPGRETALLARGEASVLVPFGDSNSAVAAAARAFALARTLALPVVLYHTTWVDPKVKSSQPEDHMCQAARNLWGRLQAQAAAAGVECTTVIEAADDVVEGIIRCGLRQSARLIVMSRSKKTTIGCYVDQALKQSPIPVLAVASAEGRGA